MSKQTVNRLFKYLCLLVVIGGCGALVLLTAIGEHYHLGLIDFGFWPTLGIGTLFCIPLMILATLVLHFVKEIIFLFMKQGSKRKRMWITFGFVGGVGTLASYWIATGMASILLNTVFRWSAGWFLLAALVSYLVYFCVKE